MLCIFQRIGAIRDLRCIPVIHKIQKRDTYGNIPVVEAFGLALPTEWSSLNTRKPEYFSALKKYLFTAPFYLYPQRR